MSDLLHRIRVFVYRVQEQSADYLLLKGDQGVESFWTPVHGPIGFGEKLENAIRREVMDDVGIAQASRLIDLEMPQRWRIGDEEVVEWNFGFGTHMRLDELNLHARWADYRWADYTSAFPSLEFEHDRAAITRLHTVLFGDAPAA